MHLNDLAKIKFVLFFSFRLPQRREQNLVKRLQFVRKSYREASDVGQQ